MEAAEGEKVSVMAIASANGVKKIFRARKTMTASCRQQIAALNKLKKSSKNETFFKESTVLPNGNIKQTELVLVTNCITQNNTSEMDNHPSQCPSPSWLETSTGVSPDDSKLKTECSSKVIWTDWSEACENLASGIVTMVSHTSHNVNNDNSTTEKAQLNDVRPISSTSGVLKRGETIFDCNHLQDIKKDSPKTNINNYSPVSEETSELSALRPINEDDVLKMKSATGLVTHMDILDTDSTNASVPSNESNASSGITGTSESVMPNFTMNLTVDSASHNLSQDCNITGDYPKKRDFSGDANVPEAKRAKTSNKSILDEIDSLIQRRIQTLFKESFDQRIQDLSQQIHLIQGKEDNAKLLTRHISCVKRLGRHIKYALRIQKEASTQSSKLPPVGSTCKELPRTVETNPSAEESSKSCAEDNSIKNLSVDCSNPVVLSDNETEQQSDQGQTQHSKKPTEKVDHSVIRKIMESIKEHRNRTLSSSMDKQPMTVIDLTDDDEQKADRDSILVATCLSPSCITSSPAPVPEEVKDNNVHQKCSEKKKLSDNKNENSSGHKSVTTNGLEKSTNSDSQLLKPPQKPELRLALVQNPKGIALSWNITHADSSCAPAQVYCLYVHQENPNNSKKLWKKIGEIKALPLPMACTLTQFVDDATYSFVLRAKDAFGRFGPLCDIQSTTLKSLNTLKKT